MTNVYIDFIIIYQIIFEHFELEPYVTHITHHKQINGKNTTDQRESSQKIQHENDLNKYRN